MTLALVAKVDGYVIAVSGGIRYLGQQKLVRIDQVGRSAALATIVGATGGDGQEPDEEPPDDDDPETPKRRRRGRRGGRGRGGRGRGGSQTEEAVAEG